MQTGVNGVSGTFAQSPRISVGDGGSKKQLDSSCPVDDTDRRQLDLAIVFAVAHSGPVGGGAFSVGGTELWEGRELALVGSLITLVRPGVSGTASLRLLGALEDTVDR